MLRRQADRGSDRHGRLAVAGLQPDLTLLSYDDLFTRYKAAVAALNQAGAADAARIERDLIAPLNEELTRRSRQRPRG